MQNDAVDRLARTLAGARTRRGVLRRLISVLGLGVIATHVSDDAAAKKKNRKKPKKNAFGCLNVGKACNGKNSTCCSGICHGKRPKHGEKDKSECKAHGEGSCQPSEDLCLFNTEFPCSGVPGANCYRTTGNASFCAELGFCMDCKKDTDCEPTHGAGAACVVCTTCGGEIDTACFSASV